RAMSSLLEHSFVRTVALERVVAPIATHLCYLVLLCDNMDDEYEQFNPSTFRLISNTEDEVLHMEMSSLLEPLSVSGRHVLLAAQKLSIQPNLPEHREELITATQNVFLGVLKVLLVADSAIVRKVLAAADRVLESLSELGSSLDIKSLLRSFKDFSESLLTLNDLTVDRANSLLDPRQTKQLLDSLETLRRCISMLHTAMCTTIKHPTSDQAQAAKRFILDKVQTTVRDISVTLKSDGHKGPLGPYGFYTGRHHSLLHLLDNYSSALIQDSGFDSMVRDIVFHAMVVANSSRRESQQRIVSHCRHILHFWSDIKRLLKSSEESDDTELRSNKICLLLIQQIQILDKVLKTAVLHQVLDTFLAAPCTDNDLLGTIKRLLDTEPAEIMDLTFLQPAVEDFILSTDCIIQVATFVSAVAEDAKSLESVENSQACLVRLRAQFALLSLELGNNSWQTLPKLHDVCLKWEEETSELQDALSDVMDLREFTSLAVDEMVKEHHGCDEAYKEQSYKVFDEHAKNLISYMKLVIRSVRRHLDRSNNPIYRNGLLVLLKQAQSSQTKVGESVRHMLHFASTLNVEMYSTVTNNVSAAIQHFKVLREGLDGHKHPHLLSPLREAARKPEISQSSVQDEPKLIHVDLLPLLYEVLTVTKGKDVSTLNQVCTGVLELSNHYVQAAKDGSAIVDTIDSQTLEGFRSELVSLTPLLVQTAQEMAMSSSMSTEALRKHSVQFSDLISNIRKVLLPVAGTWYHVACDELQRNLQTTTSSTTQNLNEVMSLCTRVVQFLTSSDLKSADSQETFNILNNKLSKTQNNTKFLIELSSLPERQVDHLEGLCLLWGLSVQILLNSLDKILGTSAAINQRNPQKRLSALSENSLRIQEAARLTSLNCKSVYKSKHLTICQNELKKLTDAYLEALEELEAIPNLTQLTKSEFLQRRLIVEIRVLSNQLGKENRNFVSAFQNIVDITHSASKHAEEAEQEFEKAAEKLVENVQLAARRVEDCLNYIRDPRARSNLRSINDHLVRLIVETHYLCDTLSLGVQIQCWSAKAHYLVAEIMKQDGIQQEVKESIKAGLQGKSYEDFNKELAMTPSRVKDVEFADKMPPLQRGNAETVDAAETNVFLAAAVKHEPKDEKKDSHDTVLKEERPDTGNDQQKLLLSSVFQASLIHLFYFLQNKDAFVNAAKEVISNCQTVTQFIRVIANHSLDKHCTVELSLIIEQILTITNQLSIISSVNAVTPGCKSSDEILVKNAQNLLQTVLRGVHAAETACITGLKQPEPNSDGAEATALCFQWKKNLEIYRAQQTTNPETDDLGLRKTSSHTLAPSLAPQVNVRTTFK
uniref:Catenin (cadherin-associated protein), alpha-like 1 n=1 Tax=Xiphophorus maculatus TaxID=8083 RepID=A0A3B5R6X0_XIPMA